MRIPEVIAQIYQQAQEAASAEVPAFTEREVYVAPSSYVLRTGATLLSGALADVQTSNDVYLACRCNTSNQQDGFEWHWTTGYTPAQANKLTFEYELYGTQAATPQYWFAIYNQSTGSYDTMFNDVWPTTDTPFSWETTAVSTYMSGSGAITTLTCDCPLNSTNWDTYADLIRVKLNLN